MEDGKTGGHFILCIYSTMDLTDPQSVALREDVGNLEAFEEKCRTTQFRSDNAERLLKFFSEYRDGAYLPDRCDTDEPVRESFERTNLLRPIRWLSQVGARVLLKRSRQPAYTASLENQRRLVFWTEHRGRRQLIEGRRDPYFLTRVFIQVPLQSFRRIGVETAVCLFKDLSVVCQADYGYFATTAERKLRHFVQENHPSGGSVEYYSGIDPELGIPGIYWVNLFGSKYVNWFGKDRFESLRCLRKELLPDGSYLIGVAKDPDYFLYAISDPAKEIIQSLNPEAFYDINDRSRKVEVPPEIAAVRDEKTNPPF